MSQRSSSVGGGGEISSHILFDEVVSLENFFIAWKQFSDGKMQKEDVSIFAAHLEDNLFLLYQNFRSDTYRHDAYEHFFVHDPKRRFISKATVRDRIVHQAIVQVLEPIFECQFIFDSYSSRKRKGTHAAVERLEKFLRQATRNYHFPIFVLKCDIRKFFDSVNHEILLSIISNTIKDEQLLFLIRTIVKSYASDPQAATGLPLGNVTSQLFANIYLDEFDHFVKDRFRLKWYVRFCDDFVIMHSDRIFLERLLLQINEYLLRSRVLTLHPQKIEIRKLSQGIDFVGQCLLPFCRVLRTKTRRRIFRQIQQRLVDYRIGAIDDEEFRQSLQSYLGILIHGANKKTKRKLKEKVLRFIAIPIGTSRRRRQGRWQKAETSHDCQRIN